MVRALPSDRGPSSLFAVLSVSFIASLGTGVFWLGLAFIAKHGYGFEQIDNLVLYAVLGVIYTAGAFSAGAVTRRTARRLSPRRLMGITVVLQGVLCLAPILFSGSWALWAAACGVTCTASLMWPLVESYLTAGRHGGDMRAAIGWFNLVWMTAVALPLFFMAPILEHHAPWAIGSLFVVNLLALPFVFLLPRQPAEHDQAASSGHVTDEYPLLLRSARVLLPMSYVLMSAMSPIVPYRFESMAIDIRWETPTTATWTVVRVAAMLVMWRLPFWHGRWGTLLLGGAAMTAGFALIVAGPALTWMLAGFTIYGVGMGVVYYAALYYAMAVGRAAVDAGGTHEGLIGAGYGAGPLMGIAGTSLAGLLNVAKSAEGAVIIGVVWTFLAISAVPAVLPYLHARRRRRARSTELAPRAMAPGEDRQPH